MTTDDFWVLHEVPAAGITSLMRIAETDGGPALNAVVVLADDITSMTFKNLQLGRVRLRDLGSPHGNPFSWLIATGKQPEELRSLTKAIETALSAARPSPRHQRANRPERPPLTRPDRTDPDGHAEAVATAYADHVAAGRQPGLAIAEESGVPVATARGWIREARRRGKLPKGRRGRAG
jgi:hypothetical protein